MARRKKILIISGVKPFPGNSGQQMRVLNSLRALRTQFKVAFLTLGKKDEISEIKKKLAEYKGLFPLILSTSRDYGLIGSYIVNGCGCITIADIQPKIAS